MSDLADIVAYCDEKLLVERATEADRLQRASDATKRLDMDAMRAAIKQAHDAGIRAGVYLQIVNRFGPKGRSQ